MFKLQKIYQKTQGPWTIIGESNPDIIDSIILPAKYYIYGQPGLVSMYDNPELLYKNIFIKTYIIDDEENMMKLLNKLKNHGSRELLLLKNYHDQKAQKHGTEYKITWKIDKISDWSV